MRKLSADWIITLDGDPIKNGVVIISNEGEVLDLLSETKELDNVEYFEGILCPGFINAHCHLELSHLRGKLPEKTGLVGFIQNVQRFRNTAVEEIMDAIEKAEAEMIKNGIVGVGDISNSENTFSQKQREQLRYHTFIEVFGFNPAAADKLLANSVELAAKAPQTATVVPHAPYSVSEELFKRITSLNQSIVSIHNQETEEESKFYQYKTGDFLKLYEGFGLDISFFNPTGKNSIATYLPWMGSAKKLLVHNTCSTEGDIDFAEEIGGNYWCLCPNANKYIEDVLPNIPLFLSKGLKMVLGTDSLASNHQLSILSEMQTVAEAFPEIDLETMLTWACKNGADFFGWEDLGTIRAGKKPGINLLSYTTEDKGRFYLSDKATITKIA